MVGEISIDVRFVQSKAVKLINRLNVCAGVRLCVSSWPTVWANARVERTMHMNVYFISNESEENTLLKYGRPTLWINTMKTQSLTSKHRIAYFDLTRTHIRIAFNVIQWKFQWKIDNQGAA